MTDHLTPENKALVERVLGYGTARTYNRHEIDRIIDAARAEGRRSPGGGGQRIIDGLGQALAGDVTVRSYSMPKPAPPSGEVREASPDLLAWLADHRRLELEYGYDDEFEAMFWRVHERSGNVNDREWDLIGQGETPLAALLSAKSYLEAKSADLTA